MAGSLRMTPEEVAAHQAKYGRTRQQSRAAIAPQPQAKRSKYRNKRVTVDGRKFDSVLEGEYYKQLVLRWRAGEVRWFSRQVQFDLPGGRVYKADFVVYLANGDTDVIDCKGCDDPMSKLKRDQVEDIWKIVVKLIRKDDVKVGAG